jgi:hypothetical protein
MNFFLFVYNLCVSGELDAAAYRLPAREDPFLGLSANIQTSEGATPTESDISFDNSKLGIDKMCGCEVSVEMVLDRFF